MTGGERTAELYEPLLEGPALADEALKPVSA